MAKYLKFRTKKGAEKRRKTTGGSFLIVPDNGGELTAEEKNKLQGLSEFKEWMEKYIAPK